MEVKYEIIKQIGVLGNPDEKYVKELNIVAWASYAPKVDIRNWKYDKETGTKTPQKGITLNKQEVLALKNLLNDFNFEEI